jgi:hypothetical protein
MACGVVPTLIARPGYDWSAAEQDWKDAAIFPVIPESALRATLGILARTVAPGKPRPAHSTR